MSDGPSTSGEAWFGGVWAQHVVEESDDPDVLDRGGWWAVMATFEGALRLWRFARQTVSPLPGGTAWRGPLGPWVSSLDREQYEHGVAAIRERIRAGDVYQVNLCRTLSAQVPDGVPDVRALAARLQRGNPAPYAGLIDVPAGPTGGPVRLVTASPELFLGRDGARLSSSPIKGTAVTVDALLPKDEAENVMIVDLVRNDLGRVCAPGTIDVPSLLRVEAHPGLVHLVSTVTGDLERGAGWRDVLRALSPPASVSGAPKQAALQVIREREPVPRGPYCGIVGWVDADRRTARLAVGIRTFWFEDRRLCFGTGAGITWGSDPAGEWRETELKAARLVDLARGRESDGVPDGETKTEELTA